MKTKENKYKRKEGKKSSGKEGMKQDVGQNQLKLGG